MRHHLLLLGLTLTLSAPAPGAEPAQKLPALATLPLDARKAEQVQTEWAKALGVEAVVKNSLGMEFVLVPAGRFEMGPSGSKYRVTLAKPFYAGNTEVTLGQYRRFKEKHSVEGAEGAFNDDDRPAAMVSWVDAQAFCRWLSEQKDEKAAGRGYALPTEAQWEWAARAGGTAPRPFGGDPPKGDEGLADHAWFNRTHTPNPKRESEGRGRQPVGKKKPNAWGLYDTLGNVWEWCADRRVDGGTGEERQPVMRGGSWRSGGAHCTVFAHDPGDPNLKADNVGFRVVCKVKPKP